MTPNDRFSAASAAYRKRRTKGNLAALNDAWVAMILARAEYEGEGAVEALRRELGAQVRVNLHLGEVISRLTRELKRAKRGNITRVKT